MQAEDWFENVTQASGIQHAYSSGSEAGFYTLLESIGGGVTLFDFNQDGFVDIYVPGGGTLTGPPIEVHGVAGKLYRNDGDFHFTEVTAEVGLNDDSLYAHGCSAADYNQDGWPDLLVVGYHGLKLYQNQNGKAFVDVTQSAQLADFPDWNIQAVWTDLDNDGQLDLYVVTYADWLPDHLRVCNNDRGLRDACGPTLFNGQRDRVFRGLPDGTFQEFTEQAGLIPKNRGLGVLSANLNDDLLPEIFVGNDAENNQLYVGQPNLDLKDEGLLAGVGVSPQGEREGTMGVAIGDFNGDGAPDLWYTNYSNQDNSLCVGVGPAAFQNVSVTMGLGGVSRRWVGFGTVLADFNHDTWPDIFVANGHVAYERLDSPYFQPPQLFSNQAGQRFTQVSAEGGVYFDGEYSGRGVAAGDLNNDGALDLVIVHQDDPTVILKNRLPAKQWVRVRLTGTTSNIDGIGSKVTLQQGERTQSVWVTGADSYASCSDRRVLFPLTEDIATDITVHWPSGLTETFLQQAPQATHELVEGTGRKL